VGRDCFPPGGIGEKAASGSDRIRLFVVLCARAAKKLARLVLIEIIVSIIDRRMKTLTRDVAEFLLIDDDPAITKFLVTYLKQKGHTCEYLTEGFQTAAWLEHHQCDVVVVDLNMPKVDGISLISFIREMSQNLPIIVFTGVGYDEERMHAALRAGANGYVSKNLPIEQLYCVLSRVLATCQQRARREAPAPPRPVLAGAA
jgi:DNA-binding NtrC family response regulator